MGVPIKPENKGRYPANWKSEVRPAILKRAENEHGWPCCEECAVPNHAWGWRTDDGTFHDGGTESMARDLAPEGATVLQIVLTIAHLDHQPENCDPANLKAWCQRCHLRYDAPRKRADARAAKAVGDMFA